MSKIDDLKADLTVVQDRLSLSDGESDATLYVSGSHGDTTPLVVEQTHANLKLVTDHGEANVQLDGEQLDGLIDTLHGIQQEYANE